MHLSIDYVLDILH